MTAQQLDAKLATIARNIDALATELVAIRDAFEQIREADAQASGSSLNGDRIIDPSHKLTVKDTGRVKLELKGATGRGEYVIALLHADTVKTVERIAAALTT